MQVERLECFIVDFHGLNFNGVESQTFRLKKSQEEINEFLLKFIVQQRREFNVSLGRLEKKIACM